MDTSVTTKQAVFFKLLFGDTEGIICIAKRAAGTKSFEEEFFSWPKDQEKMLGLVENFADSSDIWFCPQLLNARRRRKNTIEACPSVWADLDSCDPANLLVPPTAAVESSPGRWQAYWCLEGAVTPAAAEAISKRIAYYHSEQGADRSGWDLTQLLRVPYTYNHKYAGTGFPPQIQITEVLNISYPLSAFDVYPPVVELTPEQMGIPTEYPNSQELMMKHRNTLHPMVYVLYSQIPPDKSWSESLWNLELLLFEHGMPIEHVFSIVQDAACNKYARDDRGIDALWTELLRAKAKFDEDERNRSGVASYLAYDTPLLTTEDKLEVLADHTIVEEYVEWASGLGDASPLYHPAGIFTILSSIISSGVRLPTSFGTVIPNLWFMILADTTLTRKTTAMDIAMDILEELDDDAVLATDGSLEGMFSSMALRPGRSSIFLRDEFSGLLDAMFRKDYMAGMAESLTKLYDGKYQKRVLKSGTIEIRDPILILFTGGIKSRIFEQLTYDHVISGFLPRFCFIVAEADISKMEPLGPPTVKGLSKRREIVTQLEAITDYYHQTTSVIIPAPNAKPTVLPKIWEAKLTDEAWRLYNYYEATLVNQGLQHMQRDITMPALDRLAKSGLKCAVLIAATRHFGNEVVVTELDIKHAFFYVEQWREHLLTVVANIGKSQYEKLIDLIALEAQKVPGILRGTILRMFRLNQRTGKEIIDTAEERGLLFQVSSGKTSRLYPPGHKAGGE